MAKFKGYDYRQRVFLPVFLEDQLMPGTLEFAIHTLVETAVSWNFYSEKDSHKAVLNYQELKGKDLYLEKEVANTSRTFFARSSGAKGF